MISFEVNLGESVPNFLFTQLSAFFRILVRKRVVVVVAAVKGSIQKEEPKLNVT